MNENSPQEELFPEHYAEEVDASETESVESMPRHPRRTKPKKAPAGQGDMFPEDRENAQRIARWRTPEGRAAQRLIIELEKKVKKEQEEEKRKRHQAML
jgi:hypothetical protein